MTLWLNGALVDAAAARVAPGDRGFMLGDGLFETIAVREGVPLRLSAHLARLARGAEVIGLPLPTFDLSAIATALLAANGLTDAVLRLTLTRGEGPRGVLPPEAPQPTLLITTAPLATPAPPARLMLAQGTRRNEFSPLSGIKSLNYLDNILARQEAHRAGCDDALLLNTLGRLAESTIANLFVKRDGQLLTPPLSEGALPGVMRAEVLASGAVERPLTPDDVMTAEEVFLTSSLGLRSVRSFGDRVFSSFAVAERLRTEIP